ncbi:MAG: Rrf2 family transcriptional regulator [Acidobacteriia bacterium]|nr:Rrf2 family transcriptional regulator [Terriglobia bacterium]
MKLSSQEEYGLRCLLHLARCAEDGSLTIPEISRAEGLSVPNVAKLMRMLRLGGFVTSVRGQAGGYALSRPAGQVSVASVLELLGGQLFGPQFCERHAGVQDSCSHAVDCSLRVLWTTMQKVMENVLSKTTLQDLLCSEAEMAALLRCRQGDFPMLSKDEAANPQTAELT